MTAPIVVAGGGVGGLAAALALARAGRGALVLERAPKIEEIGAGLQIAPNAGRILAGLGLGEALARVGLEPRAINIRRGRDGVCLARLDLSDARERFGAPFRVYHRADLQHALLQAARASGSIDIRSGARVDEFEIGANRVLVRVHTAEGAQEIHACGLVGADGVRSSVRAQLVPTERDAPVYAGVAAWRALVPAELAPTVLRACESNLWLLPGAHVVHYPLRDGSIINVVVIVETPPSVAEGAVAPALEGAALARALAPLRPASALVDLIEAGATWRNWPLFLRPQLERWSRGAVTLLGDAAHPMLPFLAQGAAQAIEDAEALGRANERPGASVETAFADYERARLARVYAVVRASTRQGAYFHLRGPARFARDLAIRALGGRGMLARNAWLYR